MQCVSNWISALNHIRWCYILTSNLTTNSPLFIIFTTSCTPPIWSWCQWVTIMCSKSIFSPFRTSCSLFMYCTSFCSPASTKILLNMWKNTYFINNECNYMKLKAVTALSRSWCSKLLTVTKEMGYFHNQAHGRCVDKAISILLNVCFPCLKELLG